MGRVRWSIDKGDRIALRFDDAAFIDACQDTGDEMYDTLRRTLGCAPEDADFSSFIADGVYLEGRCGITMAEENKIANLSQQDDARQGIKVDIDRIEAMTFAIWCTGVYASLGELPEKLRSTRQTDRQEAFRQLPTNVGAVLYARLQVHIRDQRRPALRDPKRLGRDGENSATSDGDELNDLS